MVDRNFLRFIMRAAVFFAGFLVLLGLASIHYHYRITKRDIVFNSLILFKNESIQPRVVILGDSHAAFGILNTALPKDYYNFSHPGENWRKFLLRADAAVRVKNSVKYFVIPLDYYQFSPKNAEDIDFTDYLFFSSKEDIAEAFHPSFLEFLKAKILSIIPLVGPSNRNTYRRVLAEDIISFFAGKKQEKSIYIEDDNYFHRKEENNIWSELSSEQRRLLTADRADEQFLQPFIDDNLYSAFEKFFNLASKNNIKVIGIYFPTTREYQDAFLKFDTSSHSIAILNERYSFQPLSKTLDYSNLFDEHQEYFSDTDHLNKKGAEVFTNILVEDLEKFFKNNQY